MRYTDMVGLSQFLGQHEQSGERFSSERHLNLNYRCSTVKTQIVYFDTSLHRPLLIERSRSSLTQLPWKMSLLSVLLTFPLCDTWHLDLYHLTGQTHSSLPHLPCLILQSWNFKACRSVDCGSWQLQETHIILSKTWPDSCTGLHANSMLISAV